MTDEPEADVMERAGGVFDEVVALLFDGTRPKPYLRPDAITPIAAYGDQRARTARAAAIEEAAQIAETWRDDACRLLETRRAAGAIAIDIRALADTPSHSGWRDIASAPRDGTVVIIPGGCGYCINGVWKSWQNHQPIRWEVKWWMPLPTPPQSEGGESTLERPPTGHAGRTTPDGPEGGEG